MLGWIAFFSLASFILGTILYGEMIKDYAKNNKPYTIDGEVYYIVKKE